MRIGIPLAYRGGFTEAVKALADYEKAGLDVVFVAEVYTFDAVSQLGYIAASTQRLGIASGVMQLYTRTPTLIAMTAAGLDYVSGGRFTLGLGASGPQVIEGFHGVAYDSPLGRTRETIDICRMVWRREPVSYQGEHYQVPLAEGLGTGLGKPLKLINKPVRERIPISLAAIGPRNVELAAEMAEAWQPAFFYPERAMQVWGEPLANGTRKRAPELGKLDTIVNVMLAIGEDAAPLRRLARPELALYIGGMGAPGRNFYNSLAQRYGFEQAAARIQELYLAGRKDEAAAAIPDELVDATTLIGPASWVKERIAAFAQAGVTTLNVVPVAQTHEARVQLIEQVRDLAS